LQTDPGFRKTTEDKKLKRASILTQRAQSFQRRARRV
jgi:hypothetical protein